MVEQQGVTVTYAGRIVEGTYGEDDAALFVVDDSGRRTEPFAERFSGDVEDHGRYVIVAYYLSEQPKTADELLENELRKLAGDAKADYSQRYSDITGYLWTDQELMVGGHDLFDELASSVGWYLHMTVTFTRSNCDNA